MDGGDWGLAVVVVMVKRIVQENTLTPKHE